MTSVPEGEFHYYDRAKYTSSEALDIINGYLLQRNHVIVRRNQFLVVLNLENGIPPNLVSRCHSGRTSLTRTQRVDARHLQTG